MDVLQKKRNESIHEGDENDPVISPSHLTSIVHIHTLTAESQLDEGPQAVNYYNEHGHIAMIEWSSIHRTIRCRNSENQTKNIPLVSEQQVEVKSASPEVTSSLHNVPTSSHSHSRLYIHRAFLSNTTYPAGRTFVFSPDE